MYEGLIDDIQYCAATNEEQAIEAHELNETLRDAGKERPRGRASYARIQREAERIRKGY